MDKTEDVLDRAIIYATEKHAGMKRKGSQRPYILHPLEVAALTATMTDDHNVLAAAVLHDVVEDTPTSLDEIDRLFGAEIAGYVGAESENKREGQPAADTWLIRKQETIDSLTTETRLPVKMIALADKYANIKDLQRDYAAVGAKVWERFNQKDALKHGWYYRAIATATKQLAGYPLWQEYDQAVSQLFEGGRKE